MAALSLLVSPLEKTVPLLLVALLTGAIPGPTDDIHHKARAFRSALVERHLAPEGVVLYRINLDTIETVLESGVYPNLADQPMFTGLWAATACTRARVEPPGPGREEALADAALSLSGLELLMGVTGRTGLMARCVRRTREVASDEASGRWYPGAPPYEGYRWRGDVSIDQYANGLLPAVAECGDLFPDRTRRLVVDFATHLLDNEFHLVDPGDVRTRYGDLTWRSGLGFNAIALLVSWGAFALAADLDQENPTRDWARHRDRLRDRQRVVSRARTTNLRILGITSYSNEQMAWNLYRALVPLARKTHDPALADLRHGMHRSWQRVRGDGGSYYGVVLCAVEPESCDEAALEQTATLLADFPLDKRKLAPRPELAALPRRLVPSRSLERRARDPVPIGLRPVSSLEWKSSPYRLEAGTSPRTEYTGVDYLAAYWLLRSVSEPQPEENGR